MSENTCPTKIFDRLLLAADSCEFCEGAIREGLSIAKACGSKLYAVSVVEVNPEFDALAPGVTEEVAKDTRAHLEAVLARAQKAGVDCEIIAHQAEDVYEPLVMEAKEKGVETIVLGRRGRKGLKRLLMGSVVSSVIGHAPCNVLVIPRKANVTFGKLLVATDGSNSSDAAAAEAVAICRKGGGSLTVVTVADGEVSEADAIIRRVMDLAAKEGVKADGHVLAGRPYEAIVKAAVKFGSDLVVIGNHGRTGFDRIMMGSTTERVIGLSACAVLVVRS